MILLNFILNIITILCLFFLKMNVKVVWKKIVIIKEVFVGWC